MRIDGNYATLSSNIENELHAFTIKNYENQITNYYYQWLRFITVAIMVVYTTSNVTVLTHQKTVSWGFIIFLSIVSWQTEFWVYFLIIGWKSKASNIIYLQHKIMFVCAIDSDQTLGLMLTEFCIGSWVQHFGRVC